MRRIGSTFFTDKMLNYQQFLLLEKNRTVEFFRKNPELLSSFAKDANVHSHPKVEWTPSRLGTSIWSEDIGTYVDENDLVLKKIKNDLRKKLNNLKGSDSEKKSWTISELLMGKKDEKYGETWYDQKEFLEDFLAAKNFNGFEAASRAGTRKWKIPVGINEIEEWEEFYQFLKANFSLLQNYFNQYIKAEKGVRGSEPSRVYLGKFEKEMMKMGLSPQDVQVAMSHITDWTSMSRKKLDPSVWPLLQKISVDPSSLPKTVYRGIYIDGAKIKDEAKFLSKWKQGSKPGESQKKATSWSVDRGTAAGFMQPQDFIKDLGGGYFVLLKWTVDPKKVIADLRNLPVDHKFWNQQELIVSPDAQDYEVDTIFSPLDRKHGYEDFLKTIKGGQGAHGKTKSMFAANFMITPYETLSPNQRIEFKRINKMTVKEFISEYPAGASLFPKNSDMNYDVAMPLWTYIQRNLRVTGFQIVKATRNVIEFRFRIGFNFLDYIEDIKKRKDLDLTDLWNTNLEIVSSLGRVELLDDEYYDTDILLKMPDSYSVAVQEGSSEKPSDKKYREIFDRIGSKFFVEFFKGYQKKQQQQLPKNIKVRVD